MILYYIMKCAKIHPIFPGLYPRNFNKMGMKFLYTLQKEKEFLFSEKSCMIKVQQNAHRALKIEGGKNTMRKILATLLALVMTLALMVPASWGENKETYQLPDSLAGKTVILHTNDVHGAIDKYAKVAALRDECYDKGAHQVILLDAGDYSQGSPYVSLSKGATALDMMALVGYDVITLGNHEFDYGYDNLVNLSKEAKFPIVAANVLYQGKVAFNSNQIFTTPSGVKIGVFGLETPETATKAHPAKIKGVTILGDKSMFDCAQAQVDSLKADGCDYIICLGHLGIDKESIGNRSTDLLNVVDGIDVFIDGHSHSTMKDIAEVTDKDGKVNGTLLTSTGTKLASVGVVTISPKGKVTAMSAPTEGMTAEDKDVAARAAAIQKEIDDDYGTVFAKTKVELDGVKANVRTHETNLGDLITDALVWGAGKNGTKVDAAVTNKKGDITKKDINTVLPFGNTLSIVKVTGAELLEALEASTYCTPDSIGGFPQVSGIVYTIDGTKTYDAGDVYEGSTYHAPKTILRRTIRSGGGKAFNLRTVYTIATNDFLAAGGDTYYAFKTASVNYDLGIPMDEVVMDYVKTELKGVVSAENYGEAGDRITIIKGLPFTDVDPSAAYYSAVKYCYENNIFKGVTDTMFMPNNTITRGQMVTVLWRMNGSPEPKNANPFGDVAATSPFVKAIAWAAENKLTNGITETTFAPAQAISRQQFLTILYRYAQFMGYDVSVGEDTNILSFEDVGEVGEYAIPAMQWAVGSGVLTAEKTLTPRAAAPRYNVAEFLANFCMKVIPTAEMMPKAA